MKNLNKKVRTLLSAIALGLIVGVAPVLYGSDKGFGGDAGRGDNPVIGSLPCIVDPRLDALFWVPNGMPQAPGGFYAGLPAVGALMSSDEFEDTLFAVTGEPFGFINDFEHWTSLGFVNEAHTSVNRSDLASAKVVMWQYLPKGYLGGEMLFKMPGSSNHGIIGSQNMFVPLNEIAGHPDAIGVAKVVFSPNAANPALDDIVIMVPFHSGTVNINYLP